MQQPAPAVQFVPLPPAPTPSPPEPRRRVRPAKVAYHLVTFIVAAWVLYFIWPTGLGGSATLTTTEGRSMEPTYHDGDFVVLRATGDYQPGDIVGFIVPPGEERAGTRVLHRIIDRRSDGSLELLGDGNLVVDPWHITDDDVLGEAVLHIPGGGRVLTSTWMLVVVVAVAIARIVWYRLAKDKRRAEDVGHDRTRNS